jgi:hypothetical protein
MSPQPEENPLIPKEKKAIKPFMKNIKHQLQLNGEKSEIQY